MRLLPLPLSSIATGLNNSQRYLSLGQLVSLLGRAGPDLLQLSANASSQGCSLGLLVADLVLGLLQLRLQR